MLDEMGPYAPNGIGLAEFAECLRHLHDEHKGIALAHIRRALKAEPQNPFFLSYVGMLCAVVEKRYVAMVRSCAAKQLEIKCNHAQLYLNLAEVYRQAGRHGDAMKTLQKGFVSTGHDLRTARSHGTRKNRRASVPYIVQPWTLPPFEPDCWGDCDTESLDPPWDRFNKKFNPPSCRCTVSVTSIIEYSYIC